MENIYIVAPGKRRSRCPHCSYVTDRKNNLKRHIITMHHDSSKLLECCGQIFKSKASLREHVILNHKTGYKCHICGRNFCRKALLRRHLTVHSGQKDFRCPSCPYATSHKSNLERHQKVHVKVYETNDKQKETYPSALKLTEFSDSRNCTEDLILNRYGYGSFKIPHRFSLVGKTHARIMSRYQSMFRQRKITFDKGKHDHIISEEKQNVIEKMESDGSEMIDISTKYQNNTFITSTLIPNKENRQVGTRSNTDKNSHGPYLHSPSDSNRGRDSRENKKKCCQRIWERPYKCKMCNLSFGNQIDQSRHTCLGNPIEDLNVPITCLIMKGISF